MAWYEKTALVLAAIGAINWGLSEIDFNLVELLKNATLITAVYWIIALCGVYALYKAFK